MTRAVRHRTLFVSAEAALSFLGAGIAGTIWRADQLHQDLPCTADGGCEIVNASRWSHVDLLFLHHVPVAILGLAGYILLLSLAMLRFSTDNPRLDSRLQSFDRLNQRRRIFVLVVLAVGRARGNRRVLHLVPVIGDCDDGFVRHCGTGKVGRPAAPSKKTGNTWITQQSQMETMFPEERAVRRNKSQRCW